MAQSNCQPLGLIGEFDAGTRRAAGEHLRAEHAARIEAVTSFHHRDAQRIQPGWRGERFDRHEAVQALFRMEHRPDPAPDTNW